MSTTPPASTQGVQGITEGDIAQYLANTPAFFERHAELLGSITLSSPHGQRAVSLQERQMQMLRERIKGLEQRLIEMIRNGSDNVAIAERLYRYTQALLRTADATQLPARAVQSLQDEFMVPQAALRLWHVPTAPADDVSDDVKSFAASLSGPYCGVNAGFEAAGWLQEPASVLSLAMIPLRPPGDGASVFGLLVLGSPDATRFTAEMGAEFLVRIGEVTAAALARLPSRSAA